MTKLIFHQLHVCNVVWLPLILILIVPGTLDAEGLSLELHAAHFTPSEQVFADIYGKELGFGAELGIEMGRRFEIWVGAGYFAANGELTFTREETSLEITPVEVGVRYRFTHDTPVMPYVGLATGLYFFSESSPIGEVSSSELGFAAEVGVLISLSGRFRLDLRVDRSFCKVKPAEIEVEIGGTALLAGLRYRL